MSNNIVDLIKNSNSQIQEAQTTTADMQLSTTKLKKKKSQVRGGKKKRYITYRGTKTRTLVDFSSEDNGDQKTMYGYFVGVISFQN